MLTECRGGDPPAKVGGSPATCAVWARAAPPDCLPGENSGRSRAPPRALCERGVRGWVGLERHGRANLRVPPCGDVPEPCPPAGSRSSHAAPAQKLQMAEDSKMLAAKHGEGGNRSVDGKQGPGAEAPAPPWSRLIPLPPHSDIGVIELRQRAFALGKGAFKSTAPISADARIRRAAPTI